MKTLNMALHEIDADVHRLLGEIDVELQTLAVAIKHASPERRDELAQQYFKHVLFMAKQNRMASNKIASLRSGTTSVVQKRMLELITFQRKQLKQLGQHLHRLNLALAKEQ